MDGVTVAGALRDAINPLPCGQEGWLVPQALRLCCPSHPIAAAAGEDEERSDKAKDDSDVVHELSVPHFTMDVDHSNQIRQPRNAPTEEDDPQSTDVTDPNASTQESH